MKKLSGKDLAVSALMISGAAVVLYRLFAGLGAVSALSDVQPWGLIKSFNILTCASLAAGASVVAAMVHVFGLRKFQTVIRPALLMGLVLHTFVLIALLYDVGSPMDVWRIVLHPNLRSVMFLAFVCEALYTSALLAEVLPEFSGRNSLAGVKGVLVALSGPLAIFSATVAIIYQSTLGALYLVSPHRVDHLWYTPWLPVSFMLSAATAGLGMLVLEAYASDKAGRRPFDARLMGEVGRAMSFFLAAYVILRIADLIVRGGMSALNSGGIRTTWFLVEVCAGSILPLVLSSSRRLRQTSGGLVAASLLVVAGVAMNRAGVVMVGWDNPAGLGYLPSAIEIFASFFFIAAPVAIYSYASSALSGRAEAGG